MEPADNQFFSRMSGVNRWSSSSVRRSRSFMTAA
jgi:hypothetical protein